MDEDLKQGVSLFNDVDVK